MINTEDFYNTLIENGVDFFAGVPDSLLKNICAYIIEHTPSDKHIITANEGGAIALGAGYCLAADKIPLIYMQNSGLGNAVNPLLSLTDNDVYGIPLILMIGWRGEPNIKDEPQHIKQGRITLDLLDVMGIPYYIIDKDTDYKNTIKRSIVKCKEISAPIALVIKKNSFTEYKLNQKSLPSKLLSREEALKIVIENMPKKTIIVSTTGMLSRELFELREKFNQSHEQDFLTVGSMGHVSQIALGLALAKPEKKIVCLDGDGSALMHLGNYAIAGESMPENLSFFMFNNGAHDSVGGQPTIAGNIDFKKIMEAFQIDFLGKTFTPLQIEKAAKDSALLPKTTFVEIIVRKGNRKNLGRPTISPKENKVLLKKHLL